MERTGVNVLANKIKLITVYGFNWTYSAFTQQGTISNNKDIYEKQGINSVTPARLILSRYTEISGLP